VAAFGKAQYIKRVDDDRLLTGPGSFTGVKGVGESGRVGSTPTVMNAIMDARRPLGVRDIQMPAKPQRVWQAIQDARK
jgi:carbon-monoxide dehydrogenase large subunit